MAHADPSSELATKPLGRLLLRFAIPSIFAQIVNLLYNIVDRIFVGRIPEIGPLALAGLGVAFPIILIISSFSFLAGMGGAPLASIAMGRGDNAKAERILGSACVFLLAMSVVLTVLCFWAIPYFQADLLLLLQIITDHSVQSGQGLHQHVNIIHQPVPVTVPLHGQQLCVAFLQQLADPFRIAFPNKGTLSVRLFPFVSPYIEGIGTVCFLQGNLLWQLF